SRRRHTRSYGDWSSDVCSSDLGVTFTITPSPITGTGSLDITDNGANDVYNTTAGFICVNNVFNLGGTTAYSVIEKTAPTGYAKRSEERRVGNECGRGRAGDSER